jgi:hypothetical protein
MTVNVREPRWIQVSQRMTQTGSLIFISIQLADGSAHVQLSAHPPEISVTGCKAGAARCLEQSYIQYFQLALDIYTSSILLRPGFLVQYLTLCCTCLLPCLSRHKPVQNFRLGDQTPTSSRLELVRPKTIRDGHVGPVYGVAMVSLVSKDIRTATFSRVSPCYSCHLLGSTVSGRYSIRFVMLSCVDDRSIVDPLQ